MIGLTHGCYSIGRPEVTSLHDFLNILFQSNTENILVNKMSVPDKEDFIKWISEISSEPTSAKKVITFLFFHAMERIENLESQVFR